MYKILNEDSSLVTEYPSNRIYDLLSNKEKEHIHLFKREIDKLTVNKGFGKVTVSLFPAGDIYEKVFEVENNNGYSFKEFDEILNQISAQIYENCKNDKELKEFYDYSYIISR